MSEQRETESTDMVTRVIGGRTYYTRRDDAEATRREIEYTMNPGPVIT